MSSEISSSSHRNWAVAMAIIVSFAIATLFLTRPQTGAINLSPASGLMTLHHLSQTSVPYDQALSEPKPTLIEFYADWCTTCQSTATTLDALHQDFGTQVNFVMLNIDDPQWRSQIQQFHATGVPQLTLLEGDHSISETWVGKVPKHILEQKLQSLTI